MGLTTSEKSAFIRDGLLIKRRAITPDLVDRAREHVDHWYRESINPHLIDNYTQRTFAPDLGNHPDLLALFTASEAADYATDLLGTHQPVTTTQIQIRIPDSQLHRTQPVKTMHVDGVACPHLDPDELRTFSLLVGVLLTDISDPRGGALHYQTGGHLRMAAWFRDRWSLGITEQVPPDIEAHSGTPLLGKAGDVLLMHHLVPHSVGRNTTGQPRTMAYFRLSHPNHATHRLQALRNPWLDYPPLNQPRPEATSTP